MTLATSSPISTPDFLWPFPFCQMDWAVTPPAVQDYIETLQGRVNQLQKQVETLSGRLEKTSQTSSKPPSSDSPFNKPKRQRQKSKGANAVPELAIAAPAPPCSARPRSTGSSLPRVPVAMANSSPSHPLTPIK